MLDSTMIRTNQNKERLWHLRKQIMLFYWTCLHRVVRNILSVNIFREIHNKIVSPKLFIIKPNIDLMTNKNKCAIKLYNERRSLLSKTNKCIVNFYLWSDRLNVCLIFKSNISMIMVLTYDMNVTKRYRQKESRLWW